MKKLTNEEVQSRFENIYNGEYELVGGYEGNGKPAMIKHKLCGTIYTADRLTRFFNETGCKCPKCYKPPMPKNREKMTKENFQKKLDEKFGSGMFVCVSDVDGSKKDCKVKHTLCGTVFSTKPHEILSSRFVGCPSCHISRRGLKCASAETYLEDTLQEAEDGNEYEWLEPYKGSPRIKHKIKHLKCGFEYEVQPSYFRYGDKIRCPQCSRMRSKSEVDFFKEIKKIEPTAESSNRSIINPYELDVFIPDKKVAFEYNGLFWHSEKYKGRYYHRDKMTACNKKGIRLVQIFEDEWKEKHDIVISKIKNILGISNLEKVYARKCICKKVEDFSVVSTFLNENHIQGATQYSLAYGLYYDDKLVAIGCFNKLRNSMNSQGKENAYDMVRYAADINLSVFGGCGKIISEFVKNENCKYMKTLADLRWCDASNNMYVKLGFRKICDVPPRYFYTDGHKRYPRFNFRKDNIKTKFPEIYDAKLTEFQMMDKTQYKRIWDAGKITYEKDF